MKFEALSVCNMKLERAVAAYCQRYSDYSRSIQRLYFQHLQLLADAGYLHSPNCRSLFELIEFHIAVAAAAAADPAV